MPVFLQRLLLAFACAAATGACVTINIYFPAAAAEKAADRIIEDVWQLHEGAAPNGATNANGEVK